MKLFIIYVVVGLLFSVVAFEKLSTNRCSSMFSCLTYTATPLGARVGISVLVGVIWPYVLVSDVVK